MNFRRFIGITGIIVTIPLLSLWLVDVIHFRVTDPQYNCHILSALPEGDVTSIIYTIDDIMEPIVSSVQGIWYDLTGTDLACWINSQGTLTFIPSFHDDVIFDILYIMTVFCVMSLSCLVLYNSQPKGQREDSFEMVDSPAEYRIQTDILLDEPLPLYYK